jgi:RND superfamily putative drug exporter
MQAWAKFISKTAWIWMAVWLIATAISWFAPKIPSLLSEDSKGFLPADMPSQKAMARLREEFPDSAFTSRAVVLIVRDSGLTLADKAAASSLAGALAEKSERWNWRVTATALNPVMRPLLESSDGKAAIVVVDLPAGSLTSHTVKRFREIERTVADLARPEGLQMEITGSAAMGGLLESNAKRDVDMTTIWALAAVVVILLFVYRSPLAMLLPLVTIAAALLVSLGLVGWLASFGWPINSLVQMFMIVIVVGVGTDYCLFLFARFREDAAEVADTRTAAMMALTHAGPAVLASAGTNALGMAALWFARNRDLHTSGPTIALSIVISGACVMTLSASVIYLGGRWLVRSKNTVHPHDTRLWRWAGELVKRRPLAVTLAVGAVLLWASLLGAWKRNEPIYDSLDQFPAESSFVRGARSYSQHFQGGRSVAEATILITFPHRIDGSESGDALRGQLDAISSAISHRLPVVHYRDLVDPLGAWREPKANMNENGLASRAIIELFARPTYLGRSGKTTRIDLGLEIEPRSIPAMKAMSELREIVAEVLHNDPAPESDASDAVIDIAGENAVYADMRNLRKRDFAVVAAAAVGMIFAVLLWLLRSTIQSAILIIATLLTYLSAYGATWLIVRSVYGAPALAWQIDFLLFIVVLSLGQDYNIFVVTRVHEELRRHDPREAVATAVRRTGSVVSSCGVIMAATFASMFAGSLMMMKEFAIALSLAMLIDTFIVRPLFVPAFILLAHRFHGRPCRGRGSAAPQPQ